MVQFNLLPDVKIQYLKARRQKRLVTTLAALVVLASVTIFVIMLTTVQIFQKKHIRDLNSDIGVASKELQETKDLTKILTVQNQLNALPTLHDQKPVASRLFKYLSQMTPSQASISKLSLDFAQNTISVTGSADKLNTINTFVDTFKFTKFTVAGSSNQESAFSEVEMSTFSRDSKTATYTINAKFNPALFDATQTAAMVVPNIVTTRSEVEQPTALFQKSTIKQ